MNPAVRRQLVLVAIFLGLVVYFVTTFRMGVVRGDSMEPTYHNGQVVLVRRINALKTPLHHNDVVLVRKDRDVIIKRVYRLPGEEIPHGFPFVREFTFEHLLADYYEQLPGETPESRPRLFVPKDYLVILGDNARISEDSRFFGPVPLRDVLGVVVRSQPPPYASADMRTGAPRPRH